MLEVLIDGAGELVQTVAVEVVPPVVDALDVDAVVKRVDVEAIVERVDLDALLAKVDVNALMERVDIDAVLARTEFGAVASRSATAVASRVLDLLRSQGVGVDTFIDRWTSRLLRRGGTATAGATLEGTYADVATRFAAFLIDVVTVNVLFALGGAVVERILGLFTGRTVTLTSSELPYRIVFGAWVLLYCAYPLAVAGRTLGMSVLGLRAVGADGAELSAGRAVLRVLAFPLSFLLLGLGFLLIVVRRDHRALHDLISGSAVVYSWPARAAHLGFLERDGPVSAKTTVAAGR